MAHLWSSHVIGQAIQTASQTVMIDYLQGKFPVGLYNYSNIYGA